MISNCCPLRKPLQNILMLLPLLFLAGLVCACGSSSTSGSSPTPTTTQGIKGSFHLNDSRLQFAVKWDSRCKGNKHNQHSALVYEA